jgi:hypothetical protein
LYGLGVGDGVGDGDGVGLGVGEGVAGCSDGEGVGDWPQAASMIDAERARIRMLRGREGRWGNIRAAS